jgi:hypothetical protein
MSQLGMGVLINALGGGTDSAEAFSGSMGKIIAALSLGDDDALHFEFSDGTKMRLFDDGQSCCESRYMRTDDDLTYFIGAQLLDAEVKDAPNMPDEWGDHEVQFLEVKTSKGCFTMASHNEHNGYYGGFAIRAALE